MRTLGFWPKGEGLPPDPPRRPPSGPDRGRAGRLRSKQADDQGPREGPGRGAQAPLGGEQEAPRRGQGPARSTGRSTGARRGTGTARRTIVHAGPGVSAGLAGHAERRRGARRAAACPSLHTAADLADAIGHRAEGPPLADLPPPRRRAGPLPPLRDRQEDRRRALHLGPEAGPGPGPAAGCSTTSCRKLERRAAGARLRARPLDRHQRRPARGQGGGRQPRPEGLLPVDHLPAREGPVPRARLRRARRPRSWPCSAPSRRACRPSWTARPITSPWASACCRRGPAPARRSPTPSAAGSTAASTGLARRHGFAYTRYADDLTFSGDTPRLVGRLLRSVRSIVQAEGFTEHPRKTRVMRRGGRQEVTGVTVNDRPTVSREELRDPAGDPAQRGPPRAREPEPRRPARLRRPPPGPGRVRLHGRPGPRPRSARRPGPRPGRRPGVIDDPDHPGGHRQNSALPGVRGKGITSRMLAMPVA